MSWKVSYRLAAPLVVKTPVDGYPTLGLRFKYDGEGNLSWVEHTFETGGSDDEVYTESERRSRFLWEYLQFRSGVPIVRAQETRALVEQVANQPRVRSGRIALAAAGEDVLPVEWITESGGLQRLAHENLMTLWFHFANQAKITKSDAEAIRL